MGDILRVEDVSLENAEGRLVFQHLDWSLPVGGCARIHGAPGVGTSTFLRLCAGLADPEEGRVLLDGVALSPYAFSHPFLKKGGIGWVPMEGGLLVNLSLAANVALPLRFLRGHSQVRAEEIALEWLEAAHLSSRAEARPHALEPRERWLGALVRTAAAEANLWLVDQPPPGLDLQARAQATRLLRNAAANPETSFVIAGNADAGELNATEFRIEQGRIVSGGIQ